MAPNKITHEGHYLLPFDLIHHTKKSTVGSYVLSIHIVYNANSHLSYTAAVVPSSGEHIWLCMVAVHLDTSAKI